MHGHTPVVQALLRDPRICVEEKDDVRGVMGVIGNVSLAAEGALQGALIWACVGAALTLSLPGGLPDHTSPSFKGYWLAE